MQTSRIRPLALCVFRHGDRILIAEGYDTVKGQAFYRPLGGGIEFGETSQQTIAREIREELGVAVSHVRYLGTLENVFTFEGQPGHEIVLVYDGRLGDERLYDRAALEGVAHDGTAIRAIWKTLGAFTAQPAPLYPTGLLDLLRTGE